MSGRVEIIIDDIPMSLDDLDILWGKLEELRHAIQCKDRERSGLLDDLMSWVRTMRGL